MFENYNTTSIYLQQPYVTFGTFAPCIDNKSPNPFMPQHPLEMMKTGIKVPLLIGYNENEGSSIVNFRKFIYFFFLFKMEENISSL